MECGTALNPHSCLLCGLGGDSFSSKQKIFDSILAFRNGRGGSSPCPGAWEGITWIQYRKPGDTTQIVMKLWLLVLNKIKGQQQLDSLFLPSGQAIPSQAGPS